VCVCVRACEREETKESVRVGVWARMRVCITGINIMTECEVIKL